jgi:hypothetical protein
MVLDIGIRLVGMDARFGKTASGCQRKETEIAANIQNAVHSSGYFPQSVTVVAENIFELIVHGLFFPGRD